MRRFALIVVLALGTGHCRSGGNVVPAAPGTASPAPAPTSTSPDSIRWVRDSAEYVAALEQVYRLAGARVDAEARTHAPGSWAVVLDADETVISNVTYQEERARAGLAFSPESWNVWVKRREATPMPGAAAFLNRVRGLRGRIAIVTNRLQSECADTEAVFSAYALPYDAMLCRADGAPSDKNPRFQAVAAGGTPAGSTPLAIVAFIGDNILDFPSLTQTVRSGRPAELSKFGVEFFVVPNPMYGSWQ